MLAGDAGTHAHREKEPPIVIEKRRHARAAIDLPVVFFVKGTETSAGGLGKDISVGGIFVQTDTPAAFGTEVIVRVRLRNAIQADREFDLPGIVRWVREGGMGVQFGLLGALETHAITELTR